MSWWWIGGLILLVVEWSAFIIYVGLKWRKRMRKQQLWTSPVGLQTVDNLLKEIYVPALKEELNRPTWLGDKLLEVKPWYKTGTRTFTKRQIRVIRLWLADRIDPDGERDW